MKLETNKDDISFAKSPVITRSFPTFARVVFDAWKTGLLKVKPEEKNCHLKLKNFNGNMIFSKEEIP